MIHSVLVVVGDLEKSCLGASPDALAPLENYDTQREQLTHVSVKGAEVDNP